MSTINVYTLGDGITITNGTGFLTAEGVLVDPTDVKLNLGLYDLSGVYVDEVEYVYLGSGSPIVQVSTGIYTADIDSATPFAADPGGGVGNWRYQWHADSPTATQRPAGRLQVVAPELAIT